MDKVYCIISDDDIQDIITVTESVFKQFNVQSEILDYRNNNQYAEFDLSLPDGLRLRSFISFQEEINIRLPEIEVEMLPDFERGTVVLRAKHPIPKQFLSSENDLELTEDPKLKEAIQIVTDAGMASTTLLQRKLQISFSRASSIMYAMESMGIVGPFAGSKPREVYASKDSTQGKQTNNNPNEIVCPRCGSNNIQIAVNTYQQKKKRSFLLNLFLVVITGGIWLIWMLVRSNSVEKQAKVYVCQSCGYTETTQATDRPNWMAILSGGWRSLFAAIICIILIIFIITFVINH